MQWSGCSSCSPPLLLCSEFDVVGWVVRVGMPLKSGFRASQWIFLAEDSNGMGFLAVEFSAFAEAFVPMEEALTSTVVSELNLCVVR